MKLRKLLLLFIVYSTICYSQGIGTGQRFDLTTKLNLSSGQFAQLFIPDYFVPPVDGKFLLVFHLHSASWAAENQVYKSQSNAVLFNIHLGALSSPYQNYFSDQNKFSAILDTVLSVLNYNSIIQSPQIKYLIITSFSAGYAGLREILKTQSYYDMISAINLADGLHCNSDPGTAAIQMQDFLKFAKDARDEDKIMLLTHSSITTSGYQSTTQTANYLIQNTGVSVTPVNQTDEIGTMYAKCDSGYFQIKRYHGQTAEDHLKHLYAMHTMLRIAVNILDPSLTDVDKDESSLLNFFLYQNYPNPFNPSTVISYQLPAAGDVNLKVYDVLGRYVATLVDEYKEAGSYEVEFNPESSIQQPASGVYFYQLKVGGPQISSGQGMIQTKKMILLR